MINYQKVIPCHDGLNLKYLSLNDVLKELTEKEYSKGKYYKFKYRNVKCKIVYDFFDETPILKAYIFLNINENSRLFWSFHTIRYLYQINNDKIIIYFNTGYDLNLQTIISNQLLPSHKTFKLPSYAIKKCMEIINNYYIINK